MTITVSGTNPTVVTVATSTTTANTTYVRGGGSGNDRRYALNDDIVATIDATMNGEGLELIALGPLPHTISLTNNAIVSSLTLSNEGLVELESKRGDITYMGAGDVVSYGAASEAIRITGGTGNVTFRQAGTIIGNPAHDYDAVRVNAGVYGVVSAYLDGAITAGGDALHVRDANRVTVDVTGSITTASGQGVYSTSRSGRITYNSSGDYDVGGTALYAATSAGGIVTINVTGGQIHAAETGITALVVGGSAVVNMTGGAIGSATQRGAGGIEAVSGLSPTSGDVTVTSTDVFVDQFAAIFAQIERSTSTGNMTVTANGTTSSLNGTGIVVQNAGSGATTVTVQATVDGVIGVADEGGASTVINNGSITGTGGTAVALGAGNDTYDGRNGVVVGEVNGDAGEDTLIGGDGVDVLDGGSENDSLEGRDGNDVLNGGTGSDILNGGADNDTYRIDDAGDSIIETTGIDTAQTTVTYALAAGVAVETLRTADPAGTDAIDLTGNEFSQAVTGNAGDNIIFGKGGNDTLTGNAGADLFTFDTALNATTNVDTIADFVVADDTIRLENAVFTGLAAGTLTATAFRIGAAAADADDRIVYDSATGALYFDVNGNAAGGATKFAQLDPGLALTFNDFAIV